MAALDRRGFLQTSAAVAAATAARSALAAAPSNNINFALIGAGGQGRFVTSNYLKVPGARLTAVCDINPLNAAEAQKMSPEAKLYEDWNELLTKEADLQAVVVALPEDTHAPAAVAAMKAGKDVFCEKPMAYSLDQCRDMLDTRDATGRVLQIGQQRRSNPLYYLAHRLVQEEGVIGEVIRADAFWDRWTDWKRPLPELSKDFSPWGYPTLNHLVNWRLYRKYGHGLMTENGTHQMDACSWLLGGKRPMQVCGMGVSRYRDDRETHDVVTAEYVFEGDTIVRFSQDFHQGFNYGWSYGELLLGTEGSLRVTAEQELVVYDKDRRSEEIPIARLGDIELAGVPSTAAELTQAAASLNGGLRTYAYENEMRIFDHCVRNRTEPTCTGEIGNNSLAATVVGTEAQFSGQYQKFTPQMFV